MERPGHKLRMRGKERVVGITFQFNNNSTDDATGRTIQEKFVSALESCGFTKGLFRAKILDRVMANSSTDRVRLVPPPTGQLYAVLKIPVSDSRGGKKDGVYQVIVYPPPGMELDFFSKLQTLNKKGSSDSADSAEVVEAVLANGNAAPDPLSPLTYKSDEELDRLLAVHRGDAERLESSIGAMHQALSVMAQEEAAHQRQMAELDKQMAACNAEISRIGKNMAGLRVGLHQKEGLLPASKANAERIVVEIDRRAKATRESKLVEFAALAEADGIPLEELVEFLRTRSVWKAAATAAGDALKAASAKADAADAAAPAQD